MQDLEAELQAKAARETERRQKRSEADKDQLLAASVTRK